MTDLLAEHTTLRLGGAAPRMVRATTEAEIVEAVADPETLVLGGGSNLVVADEGVSGPVVAVRTRGISSDADACGGAVVRVAAGERWTDLVDLAVAEGWRGIEALAGIPGSVGATPVQNVGAYGQEVAETIASVRCFDRQRQAVTTLFAADCRFGYRTSRLKQEPGRWVVLEVVFQFRLGDLSMPVRYAELARTLGIETGQSAPAAEVREAVLGLRRGKGMVLDPDDHDTWSAGSFFTNPIVAPEQVPEDAPAFAQPDGSVKTSAAWLIEHAGFTKGYTRGRVGLSTKHTLALTNRGSGSTAELLELAREIRDGVRDRFGITLVNEPVLVGCRL